MLEEVDKERRGYSGFLSLGCPAAWPQKGKKMDELFVLNNSSIQFIPTDDLIKFRNVKEKNQSGRSCNLFKMGTPLQGGY